MEMLFSTIQQSIEEWQNNLLVEKVLFSNSSMSVNCR